MAEGVRKAGTEMILHNIILAGQNTKGKQAVYNAVYSLFLIFGLGKSQTEQHTPVSSTFCLF